MLLTKFPDHNAKPEAPHSTLLKLIEIVEFHCKSAEFELMLETFKLLGCKQVGHALNPYVLKGPLFPVEN